MASTESETRSCPILHYSFGVNLDIQCHDCMLLAPKDYLHYQQAMLILNQTLKEDAEGGLAS